MIRASRRLTQAWRSNRLDVSKRAARGGMVRLEILIAADRNVGHAWADTNGLGGEGNVVGRGH